MMSSEQFRAWRKALGWKQKEAAERLGLRKRMIQYYEKGNRDGKDVRIPKTVRLACYALASGIDDFDGAVVVALPSGPQRAKTPEPSGGHGGNGGAPAETSHRAEDNVVKIDKKAEPLPLEKKADVAGAE